MISQRKKIIDNSTNLADDEMEYNYNHTEFIEDNNNNSYINENHVNIDNLHKFNKNIQNDFSSKSEKLIMDNFQNNCYIKENIYSVDKNETNIESENNKNIKNSKSLKTANILKKLKQLESVKNI